VAVNLLASVQAIVRGLRGLDLQRVTYYGRSAGDAYVSVGTVFDARRKPTTRALIDGLSRTVADWTIFAAEGQPAVVKPLGKIVAANGEVWHIGGEGSVGRRFGDMIFDAQGCVLEV
jgi:hypothetical protein